MEQKRCYSCMRLKNRSPLCEHCGYDDRRVNRSHQLPRGTVLKDQYIVGKVLGQGGFGITYMGWDKNLDTPVAIKEYYPNGVVRRDATSSHAVVSEGGNSEKIFQENRKRFLREAQVMAKLGGISGIVRVQNLFQENETAYIVMEYLQGQTLKDYVKNVGGKLTAAQTFALLRPVMSVLHKIHLENTVHRDISPDNIMLTYGGKATLLDFGAAREVHDAAVDKNLTVSTMAIFKRGYAPLEQYESHGALGPWTDVYAMCGTIYYCLKGEAPPEVHDRLLKKMTLAWDTVPGLTAGQRAVLDKGMALLPEDRIGSMEDLERALFDEEFATTLIEVEKPDPVQPPPKPKKWIPAAVVAVAAVVAAALLIPKLTAAPEKPDPEVPSQTVSVRQETPAPIQTAPSETQAALETTVPPATVPPTTEPKPIVSLKAGQLIRFGSYEQDNNSGNGAEDIQWQVLKVEDGKALLHSVQGLDCRKFHGSQTNVGWDTCELRQWLNGLFLQRAFDEREQAALAAPNSYPISDKVFLLTVGEAELYYPSRSDRVCVPTDYSCAQGTYRNMTSGGAWWWLRSEYVWDDAPEVDSDGTVSKSRVNGENGTVRPAVWVDMSQLSG